MKRVVMISGVSLNIFYYSGEFYNEYRVYNSSSLVNATIVVGWSLQRQRQVAHRMYILLTGFYRVKELILADSALKVCFILSL